MADKAASVLTKLKNKSKASGISYQQCLQLFVQEEFLRKLSKSGYDNFLILKGGLFMLTMRNTLNCLKNYKNAQFIGFRIITRNSSKGLTNDIIFENFDLHTWQKCSGVLVWRTSSWVLDLKYIVLPNLSLQKSVAIPIMQNTQKVLILSKILSRNEL